MTRFASRSSGFVLFAPPFRDPPVLSSSRPWRDEHIRSRAELSRRGAKGRTTPVFASARACTCHVCVHVYAYIRVYICICMCANGRARAHRMYGMRELMWVSSSMYRRMLRQRMRNEVRASASHRIACDREREWRVFTPAMYVCGIVHRRG